MASWRAAGGRWWRPCGSSSRCTTTRPWSCCWINTGVGKEVVGPTLNKVDHKDSGEGPEEPTSRVGGGKDGVRRSSWTQRRLIRNRSGQPLVDSDWSVLCKTLCDEVGREDGSSMYNTLWEAADESGHQEDRERTSKHQDKVATTI